MLKLRFFLCVPLCHLVKRWDSTVSKFIIQKHLVTSANYISLNCEVWFVGLVVFFPLFRIFSAIFHWLWLALPLNFLFLCFYYLSSWSIFFSSFYSFFVHPFGTLVFAFLQYALWKLRSADTSVFLVSVIILLLVWIFSETNVVGHACVVKIIWKMCIING